LLRELALIVHLVGVLLWIGGAATAAWTAAQIVLAPADARREGLGAARRALLTLASPGLVLAWMGGLAIVLPGWSELYARAGWMHGKILVGLVLAALTGVLTGRVRRAASGEREASSALFAGIATVLVLGAAVAVALVVLRPGG
jgi:putative membrane protein